MKKLFLNGNEIGEIEARTISNQGPGHVRIYVGGRRVRPEDEETSEYDSLYQMHSAGNIRFRRLPADMTGPRDYPDPTENAGNRRTQVDVYLRQDVPKSVIDELLDEHGYLHDSVLIRAIRHVAYGQVTEISRDGNSDVHLDERTQTDMIQAGRIPPTPTFPIYEEWTPTAFRQNDTQRGRAVRARYPVTLNESRETRNSNLSLARALLKYTRYTPVNIPIFMGQKMSYLPVARVRAVSCRTQNGEVIPGTDLSEHLAPSHILIDASVESPDGIIEETISADFFLDDSRLLKAYTNKGGTLLVATISMTDPEETIENVTGQIQRLLGSSNAARYRTSLAQMLLPPERAATAGMEYILRGTERVLRDSQNVIGDSIPPGTEIRNGDFVIRYEPKG